MTEEQFRSSFKSLRIAAYEFTLPDRTVSKNNLTKFKSFFSENREISIPKSNGKDIAIAIMYQA
jgi:hypothetical protein